MDSNADSNGTQFGRVRDCSPMCGNGFLAATTEHARMPPNVKIESGGQVVAGSNPVREPTVREPDAGQPDAVMS